MRLRTRLTRYIAMLLTAVMAFCAVPMVAFAKDTSEGNTAVSATDASSAVGTAGVSESAADGNGSGTGVSSVPSLAELFDGGAAEVTPLFELTERRDAYTKHIRMSDGSTVAASYLRPIHTVGEDGTLVDIDNTLTEDGSDIANASARIKLAKKITGNERLYTLRDGSYKLTVSLVGAHKGTVGTVENGEAAEGETALAKMLTLSHLTSSVTYADILDGVDIEYVIDSLDIKENIIVKEQSDNGCYVYTFVLELGGLAATLRVDGAISITDSKTGAAVYTMPAPIVFDAGGTVAPEGTATYALTDGGNGKYTLTVTADPAWMQSEARVYPITVDPTVGLARNGILDVYVSDDAPTVAVEGSSLYLKHNTTVYLHLPSTYLPTIGRGTYVSEARLCVSGNNYGTTVTKVHAYEVTTPFTVTQNADGSYTFAGGTRSSTALDAVSFDKAYLNSYRFDITPVVQGWYSDGQSMDIALRASNLSATDTTYATVFPTEGLYDGFGVWPYLEVRYVEAAGLEDYYPTETHTVGAAGSGSIQLAAGALTFLLPTLSTTDSLMPASPTLVYNSTMAGLPLTYGNCDSGYTTAACACGFQLSLQQTLISIPCSDEGYDGYYLIYKDGDGTEHYFPGSGSTYNDQAALGRVIKYDHTLASYVMTYRDGTKKYFACMTSTPSGVSSAWYLNKIEDANGNALLIDKNSAGHPEALKLLPAGAEEADAIEMLTFVYSGGILQAICNDVTGDAVLLGYASSATGSVTNTASAYLRKVVYAHSDTVRGSFWGSAYTESNSSNVTVLRTTELSYTSDGLLTSVYDTESKLGIRYTWGGNDRVTSVTEYSMSTGSILTGQSISITTLTGFAEVRSSGANDALGDDDDILTRYTMDTLGRAVTVYSISPDGQTLYGATSGEYSKQSYAINSLTHVVEGGSTVSLVIDGGFEKDFSSYAYWVRNSADTVQQISDSSYREQGSRKSVSFLPTTATPATLTQALLLPSGDYAVAFDTYSQGCASIVGTVSMINASTGAVLHTETVALNAQSTLAEEGRFATTFTVPEATESTTVLLRISFTNSASTVPTLRIDNVTLTPGTRASEFSLVRNGGFEPTALNSSTLNAYTNDEFWVASRSYDPGIYHTYALQGNGGLVVSMWSDGVGDEVYQTIFTAPAGDLADYDNSCSWNFEEDTAFILSGFAKLNAENPVLTAPFGIRIDIHYYRGAGSGTVVRSYNLSFHPEIEGWQYGSMVIPLYQDGDRDGSTYVCISRIELSCQLYDMPSASAYFDNVSFVPLTTQNSTSYSYNANGQPTLSKDQSSDTYYGYDSKGQLVRVANNHGELINYTYDDTVLHRVVKETEYAFTYNDGTEYPYKADDPDALITKTAKTLTEYTYNAYGQCTKVSKRNIVSGTIFWLEEEDEYYFVTACTYNTTATSPFIGQLLTETDTYGNTVRYLYDSEDGKLLATVDAKGNATVHQYDAIDRLIGVRPGTYDSSTKTATADTSDTAERVLYSYSDDNGMLSKIETGSTVYSFTYDAFGNTASTQVGGQTVVSYEYNDNNGKLKKITYANGFAEDYEYGALDRVTEVWYTEDGVRTQAFGYLYTDDGKLLRFDNLLANETTVYRYDTAGRLVSAATSEADVYKMYAEYGYNEFSDLQSLSYTVGYGTGQAHTSQYTYGYNADRALSSVQIDADALSANVAYQYDAYNRLARKTLTAEGFTVQTDFTYKTLPSTFIWMPEYPRTGNLISKYTSTVNGTVANEYTYTYDENGYITKITYADGKTVTYTYDDRGQLLTEVNEVIGRSYTYAYDKAGNRTYTKEVKLETSVTVNELDHTYQTDGAWGDALSTWRGEGWGYHTVDGIGNLTGIVTGPDLSFSWTGRQLTAIYGPLSSEYYTYNDQGQRITKTCDGITTEYIYDGDRLIAEVNPNEAMIFLYDEGSVPVGMKYRASTDSTWTVFWFEKNLHGDIVAVYSADGVKQVSYNYNAWGEHFGTIHVSGTKATKNPFRYRGYYYEISLGLYRTQTRIYDPYSGRFVSPDLLDVINATPMALTDKNLYLYCDNNPVMRADPDGKFWETVFDVLSLGASIVEVCVNPSDPWAWVSLVGDIVDLAPFVTGVGETTKAIKVTTKVVDNADDVIDAAKTLYRGADAASDIRKATGAYEIIYESGKNYVGKGGFNRAITSAQQHMYDSKTLDRVTSIRWKSAPSARDAFIDEYLMMDRKFGVGNAKTYNKIWSPGRKYYLP